MLQGVQPEVAALKQSVELLSQQVNRLVSSVAPAVEDVSPAPGATAATVLPSHTDSYTCVLWSPARSRVSPARVSPPPLRAGAGVSEEELMQLGHSRLTTAERRRRLSSGACLYCGQEGHFVTVCPVHAKD